MRGAEAGADGAALIEDLAPGGARRIALRGLDATAVAELAEDVLGGRPDAALTDLVARAGGIPGIVVDLLEGLVEDGLVRMAGRDARLVSNGMPHRLRATLAHHVDCLDPNAAHVVRVASVLGRCSMEQLAAMLDTTPAALLRPVQQAFDAELLRDDDGAID